MRLIRLQDKIITKLIWASAVSFILSFITFLVVAHFTSLFYMANPEHLDRFSVAEYNLVVLLTFLLSSLVFVITFMLLVRRKVNYLRYITAEIHKIAQGQLGTILEVQGHDELAQLSSSINMMSLELQRKFETERDMEKAKNELITNISHDLRTPLTSIIGYMDLLRKSDGSVEARQQYLETIYNKAQNLNKLINELFEYTRLITPGYTIQVEPVELNGLLEQVFGETQILFEREGLTFNKEFPKEEITLNLDVDKIVRVFDNILENARKYSVKPSVIQVQLIKQGVGVQVRIRNRIPNHIGFEPDRVFERFYRGQNPAGDDEGTGLGLAIAKRIIDLHRGQIWAEYHPPWVDVILELS